MKVQNDSIKRVLMVHNYYQQPGGEDRIFEAEWAMLEKHGCRVFRYTVHNDLIKGMSFLKLALFTLWNRAAANELRKLIWKVRPDVIHFHNTFPLISPAAYYIAKIEGVPVVQTLNNYRFLCPNALFFRTGHVCEDCIGKFVPLSGILHACYRNNRIATSVIVAMLLAHRVMRTYSRMIDIYIAALTDFAREKFTQGGIPAGKIIVKPNFVDPDPGIGAGKGGYALFVGRLTQEKGINTLLSAWKIIDGKLPLKIIGDGPLASWVAEASKRIPGLEWVGHKPRQFVLDYMKAASVLIFPSIWYEGFPVTIVEAYASGLPVVAGNIGGMSEIILHKRTGLHFRSGDPDDLAEQIGWLLDHPAELIQMRRGARAEYMAKYTAERNYEMLMEIYNLAVESKKK